MCVRELLIRKDKGEIDHVIIENLEYSQQSCSGHLVVGSFTNPIPPKNDHDHCANPHDGLLVQEFIFPLLLGVCGNESTL
jgi:hypothetical protein